jgi:arylsulfatase A-like enzyme
MIHRLLLLSALWLPGSLLAASPNFVFILADDQAWNGTSVKMSKDLEASRTAAFHTPNLERLAAQGITFSQAYAAHPKCEASRAAMQMGRTTTTLNATDKTSRQWSAPISDSLANVLKRARPEYRAAHLGKWQWFHTPEAMGYDVSDGITMNEDGDSPDPNDPKLSFSLTRRAVSFMEQQVKEQHPFYLQLSYYAVHNQPQSLASTVSKYEARGGDRAIMAAMTEDLDSCIGTVLQSLEKLGIADQTVVIYQSDNGGRTGYLAGGKGNLFEGGLRIPMILRIPGVPGGRFCDTPVISYDLYPTILDLAAPDAPLPPGIEGGSWRSLWFANSDATVKRPIPRFVFHQAVEVDHPQSAIRKGNAKLIYYWDTHQTQLYDLASDLTESKDLSQERPDVTASLLSELRTHVAAGIGEATVAALERGERPVGPRRPGDKPRPKPPRPRP